MTDPTDELRKIVRAEIERVRDNRDVHANQPKVLGAFLDAALTTMGRSRAEFAQSLRMDAVLVDAILDGLLPESEIDDATLVDMARAVDFEPNLLRAMLGRTIVPASDDTDARKHAR